MSAIVLSPFFAAISSSPARNVSAGDTTMKMFFRPFSQMDVVEASGASITLPYFSVTLATASVMFEA